MLVLFFIYFFIFYYFFAILAEENHTFVCNDDVSQNPTAIRACPSMSGQDWTCQGVCPSVGWSTENILFKAGGCLFMIGSTWWFHDGGVPVLKEYR